jgi:transcription termination factor Rho
MTTTPTTTAPARRRGSSRPADERPQNQSTAPNRPPGAGATTTTIEVDGLVDIVNDRAWIRADGYRPGPRDLPVNLKDGGLRRGDHVRGTATGNGRRPATLRVDEINGREPAAKRPDFYDLTPVYPRDRLRLETDPGQLTTRVIDLVTPIGKGQRALIVAPPKAGKTMILQAIAAAISRNHPECHLMALLVDERPEEVTDMERTVRGEVISATFDQTPQVHTAVAELAVERAKRLVEDGRDVVLLLDSITRLGRAYNLAAPGRGRTLSGGLDSSALHPPKRLLGAARALEGGGSLTIIATALVENGSVMDSFLFEEFKGTGNAELKLDRGLAEARIFPAIDVAESSTRHDELLQDPAELAIGARLRRVIESPEHYQRFLAQLRGTPGNPELLRSGS